MTALIVDAAPGDALGVLPFETLSPDALSLGSEAFRQMATYYDATELSNALKPFLLEFLRRGGDDVVMYLDPSVEVFAPLDDMFELARHGIVLTPHITRPPGRAAGANPADESFLLQGQFNLGFIAVGDGSAPFLSYLCDRTRLFALRDPANGYYLDQRWADSVPAMFDHTIVRDPTCNVAWWNLHERKLQRRTSGWTIDGRPLRFFQFRGYDPTDCYSLSSDPGGAGRIRVDQHPALRQMLREQAERLIAAGWTSVRPQYRWSRAACGVELDRPLRKLYWQAVHDAEREARTAPPHAFGADEGRSFMAWLGEPVRPGSPVPRHLYAHWAGRTDLRCTFPDVDGPDGERLVRWARDDPLVVYTTPPELRNESSVTRPPLSGVNLVGYLDGEFGVGAAGRMVARMIAASGIPLATTMLRTESHKHRHAYPSTIDGAPFDVSVLAVNANSLLEYSRGPDFAKHSDTTRVGVWYWEVGVFPESMHPAFDLVHEVWCASEHVRATLAAAADVTVRKHPLIIEAPASTTSLLRADLGLPDDEFLFGFAFDYSSVVQRKNPIGLIEAYRRAFGPHDGAALVLKTINAHHRPSAAAAVREAAAGRDDVVFLDDHLDTVQMRAWFDLLDCYVSLHRSEGLGLTIAMAMAAGKPAVATGWSGNVEFMTPENSVLVPYQLTDVGPGAFPYPADACWASPDLDAAAHAMRDLYDHPAMATELGNRGAASITQAHDVGTAAEWFGERFVALTPSKT